MMVSTLRSGTERTHACFSSSICRTAEHIVKQNPLSTDVKSGEAALEGTAMAHCSTQLHGLLPHLLWVLLVDVLPEGLANFSVQSSSVVGNTALHDHQHQRPQCPHEGLCHSNHRQSQHQLRRPIELNSWCNLLTWLAR